MYKRVTVVNVGNVNSYPPVISLLENLIDLNCEVRLISGTRKENLPPVISSAPNIQFTYIEENTQKSLLKKIERNSIYKKQYRDAADEAMKDSDVLWTTTDVTVKILGDVVLKYRHVMQLMELIEYIPQFGSSKRWTFPIDKYARQAWKVVVPQLDRAYIQKTWWQLEKVPYVLPNKPYSIAYGEPTEQMLSAHESMEKEHRKIILYLGVIAPDRNIEKFADALEDDEDYVLCLIGRAAYGHDNYLTELLANHKNIKYLGFFTPPQHLYFLKEAYIGLLPYVAKSSLHYSVLNAQYCAPNKIFEYAGFGVPMLGTDVLGIRRPLDEFKIGTVLEDVSEEAIKKGIEVINRNYESYSENCKAFFESVDLEKIVVEILS